MPIANFIHRIWDDLELELDSNICKDILADIVSDVECIRNSVAVSLKELLENNRSHLADILQSAMDIYQDKLYVC